MGGKFGWLGTANAATTSSHNMGHTMRSREATCLLLVLSASEKEIDLHGKPVGLERKADAG